MMMLKKEIHNVELGPAETQFKWKIPNFFSVTQDENVETYESESINFIGANFNLRLYPRSRPFPGFMKIGIVFCGWFLRYPIEYSFGFEKSDGSVEKIVTGIMINENKKYNECILKLSEIQQRKSELAPSDVVTITCKLKKCMTPHTTQSDLIEEPKHKKLKKLDTLSGNFKSLFEKQESCDVTLCVMDKEYKAHSVILAARSPVFAAMFHPETSEELTGMITVSGCSPKFFKLFLEFLYSGEVEDLSTENMLHLYEISNIYDVQELKAFCEEFLIENLAIENVCDVVIIADKCNNSKLSSAARDFFYRNLDQILKSSEWDSFVKSNYILSRKLLAEMSLKMKFVQCLSRLYF